MRDDENKGEAVTQDATVQPEPHADQAPIRFALDEPSPGKRTADRLRVSGWAFCRDAPIVRVEALLDGRLLDAIPHGLPRMDVQSVFPDENAANAGFSGQVDLHVVEPGSHTLTVRFSDGRGRTAQTDVDIVYDQSPTQPGFPEGHYYSPIVNRQDVRKREGRIWPPRPSVLGIDFNQQAQRALLTDVFPAYLREFDYPERPRDADPTFQFYTDNPAFGGVDARALFVMLRHFQPKRMIEVGSGLVLRGARQGRHPVHRLVARGQDGERRQLPTLRCHPAVASRRADPCA